MKWPWQRQRYEVEQARRQAVDALGQRQETESRHSEVQQLIRESAKTGARLRRELATNGFTELMARAWGGR